MKKNILISIAFVLLLLIGIIPRFVGLNNFPNGISHDEIEYVLSAKSYLERGVDLSNIGLPDSIFRTKTVGSISFLPAIVLAPLISFFDITQGNIRLIYSLISIITCIGIFLLASKIFNNKKTGVVASLVFLYSPWSFYFSRMASDTAWSLMFFVYGWWWYISNKKYWWLSGIMLLSSFFSYHGAKFVIPLVLLVLGVWKWQYFDKSRQEKFKTTIIIGIYGIVMIGYFAILFIVPSSIVKMRESELVFTNVALLEKSVNKERNLTVTNRFTPYIINKATTAGKIIVGNYLNSFSPKILFLEGDSRSTYKFGRYGLLHIIEIVILSIGIVSIWRNKNEYRWLLTTILAISVVPAAISTIELSVINRGFVLLPVLVLILAKGWDEIISNLRNRKLVSIGIVMSLLLSSWGGFLYFYYFRFPKVNQEAYFLSERLVANYVNRDKQNSIVVITEDPREVLLETVFYNYGKGLDVTAINEGKYHINNTVFQKDCPEEINEEITYIAQRGKEGCFENMNERLFISEEEFGGPLYNIYQDQLCDKFSINSWITDRNWNDYQVEKLGNDEFCSRWILK